MTILLGPLYSRLLFLLSPLYSRFLDNVELSHCLKNARNFCPCLQWVFCHEHTFHGSECSTNFHLPPGSGYWRHYAEAAKWYELSSQCQALWKSPDILWNVFSATGEAGDSPGEGSGPCPQTEFPGEELCESASERCIAGWWGWSIGDRPSVCFCLKILMAWEWPAHPFRFLITFT